MGFALLCTAFAALVAVCFVPAVVELRRPKDPGPLPIDPKRDIQDRHFALAVRERAGRAGGPLVFDGDLRVTTGAWHDTDILVAGDATVGEEARVRSIVAEGCLTLGSNSRIDKHAEGVRTLVLQPGASVGGRATSRERIVLAAGASLSHAAAREIVVAGASPVRPAPPTAAWNDDLAALLERLLEGCAPFETALGLLSERAGAEVSGVEALSRAQARHLLPEGVSDLAGVLEPSWLSSQPAWYLGAATARVRGDLFLPPGALVPFHLIVEGDLAAGPGARLHGGVSAEGDVYLGSGSVVRGSVTARGDVRLGPGTRVAECVATAGHAEVGASCSIGGERSGGLTAEGHATLAEGVLVRHKLFALAGASVLDCSPEMAHGPS